MRSRADALPYLGAAVAEVREAHGMSHADVIGRVEPELNRQLRSVRDLELIELGERDPNFLTLVAIARAIGMTLGELLAVYERRRGVSPSTS
jgi:transcriptional regulator with XRE-family HTH domain